MAIEVINQDQDILLIRQGEYVKELAPHGLTAKGVEQTKNTGKRLQSQTVEGQIQTLKIGHSGLRRAVEAAQIFQSTFNQPMDLEEDVLLNEGSPIEVRCNQTTVHFKLHHVSFFPIIRISNALRQHSGNIFVEVTGYKQKS